MCRLAPWSPYLASLSHEHSSSGNSVDRVARQDCNASFGRAKEAGKGQKSHNHEAKICQCSFSLRVPQTHAHIPSNRSTYRC